MLPAHRPVRGLLVGPAFLIAARSRPTPQRDKKVRGVREN